MFTGWSGMALPVTFFNPSAAKHTFDSPFPAGVVGIAVANIMTQVVVRSFVYTLDLKTNK